MNKPYYILAAYPTDSNRLKNIFESGDGSIMEMLRNPDQLRHAGWDLRTYDNPSIMKGEYLEVKSLDYKIIKLYEDGTLILRALADSSFLCWGVDDDKFEENPKLNPLPLIEVTYNFVDFYIKLIPKFKDVPSNIAFTIQFTDTFISSKSRLFLSNDFFETKYLAPDIIMEKKYEISVTSQLFSVGHITFSIISSIYTWFGVEINKIPYKEKDKDGNYFIDKERIIRLKPF